MSAKPEQKQQQQQLQQQQQNIESDQEIMKPDDLFQLLLQENLIPKVARNNWRDLGIQLNLSYDDLDAIEQNVVQGNVVPITEKILKKWTQSSRDPNKLIEAIHNCELVAYAASLKKDLDLNKDLTDRDLKKIIPNIATKWKDVGIELGVGNLDNFAGNPELTEEKFKQMLKVWLNKNAKPVDELCAMFHEGLKEIELFRAAEEFKENYEEFKTKREALKKLA